MDTSKKLMEIKYVMLVPTNESKENIKKYEEKWIKIRDLIRSITKNSDIMKKNLRKSNLLDE